MWFFTADLHLNHSNIIKYCNRPFCSKIEQDMLDLVNKKAIPISDVVISKESTDSMTDSIINSINSVVSRKDNLVIIGDFCHTKNKDRDLDIKKLRDRINCFNVYLILGNHDDRKYMSKYFTCYDQYTFKIDGQVIFTFHYPCRSWDKKSYGSWMLYGHTHGFFSPEDDGMVLKCDVELYRDSFASILNVSQNDDIVNRLVDVISLSKGNNLTMDVGVDNFRPNISFGTPWSMDEISNVMKAKTDRNNNLQNLLKNFKNFGTIQK